MKKLVRQDRRISPSDFRACELLLGTNYCAELKEADSSSSLPHPKSYRDRREEKREIKKLLSWLSKSDALDQTSEKELFDLQRLIVASYLRGKIDQKLGSKLDDWSYRLIRSLRHNLSER